VALGSAAGIEPEAELPGEVQRVRVLLAEYVAVELRELAVPAD